MWRLIIFFIVTFALLVCMYQEGSPAQPPVLLEQARLFLKTRRDNAALSVFEEILRQDPKDLDARWGKAEVLRRLRKYEQSYEILTGILSQNQRHIPSLISISYIHYKNGSLDKAEKLLEEVLNTASLDQENKALAYVMLGTIAAKRCADGWLFGKFKYISEVKRNFLKATELSPELPEAHLGLGTFYFKAPRFMGGSLKKALEELLYVVRIAPDFATAHARLAQVYKNADNEELSNFHFQRCRELDPDNDVLKEIE